MKTLRTLSALTLALMLMLGLSLSSLAEAQAPQSLEDWAKEECAALLEDMKTVMEDENYLAMVSGPDNMKELLSSWREQMAAKDPEPRTYPMPDIETVISAQPETVDIGRYHSLSDAAKRRVQMAIPQILANMATAGDANVIIASSFVNTLGIAQAPEGFEEMVMIYEYQDVAAMMSFMEREGYVFVQATMVPLKITEMLSNMEKDLDKPESTGK